MKKEKMMRKHMQERIEEMTTLSLNPPLPACLNIEVNNTCNHECVFCPYHGKYAPRKLKPAVLEIDFVKELLVQAANLGIGRKELGFYIAGEPLLYDGMVELVQYSKSLGFPYVFMTTNGSMATPEKMKQLIDAGLDSIRFSVNAPDRERYKEIHGRDDFDKVVGNIKNMRKYLDDNNLDIATSLSCVITKKTIGIQKQMKDIFSPYVDDIMFIPVILKRLNNIKEVKEKYEIINDDDLIINPDFKCAMLFNTMYINAYGKTMPCCEAYDDEIFFYDLKKNPDLKKAWESEEYKRYRKIFVDGESDAGTLCEHCILRVKASKRLMMED